MKTALMKRTRVSCVLTFVILVLGMQPGIGMPTLLPHVEHPVLGMSTSTRSLDLLLPPVTGTTTAQQKADPHVAKSSFLDRIYQIARNINTLVKNVSVWMKTKAQLLYHVGIFGGSNTVVGTRKTALRGFKVPPVTTVDARSTINIASKTGTSIGMTEEMTSSSVKHEGIGMKTTSPYVINNQVKPTGFGISTSTISYDPTLQKPQGEDMTLDEILGAFKVEFHRLVGGVSSFVKNVTGLIKTSAQRFSQWITEDNARIDSGTKRKRVKRFAVPNANPFDIWKRTRIPSTTEIPVVEEVTLPPVKPRITIPLKLGFGVDSRLLTSNLHIPPPTFMSHGASYIYCLLAVVFALFLGCFLALTTGRTRKSKIVGIPHLADDVYAYILTVKTGFRRNAGTNSKVKIQLFSNNSASPQYSLSAHGSRQKVFTRGSESMFILYTKAPLGELTSICTTQQGTGVKGKWYLDSMIVSDPVADREWWFDCKKWLKTKHDGVQEHHTFTLTTTDSVFSWMWSTTVSVFHQYHRWIYPALGGGREHMKVLSRPLMLVLLLSAVGNFLLGNILVETALLSLSSQHEVQLTANVFFYTFMVNGIICFANCMCELILGNIRSKELCRSVCLETMGSRSPDMASQMRQTTCDGVVKNKGQGKKAATTNAAENCVRGKCSGEDHLTRHIRLDDRPFASSLHVRNQLSPEDEKHGLYESKSLCNMRISNLNAFGMTQDEARGQEHMVPQRSKSDTEAVSVFYNKNNNNDDNTSDCSNEERESSEGVVSAGVHVVPVLTTGQGEEHVAVKEGSISEEGVSTFCSDR
ncbi:uncharacterized protein LOC106179356 [Lingula anatina]|uniref:Uncharacterized protein LOC106179356 n=1 Tax=Lingula anatina TaxID=7574 RepID=A0A1S3K7J7_LINAN|nr:uncharacterized protein LOC106179356 [Lingula anatina]|eukprot:XP_013418419.1 uncharacterized protein LOC106179356 [Lingula anatina]